MFPITTELAPKRVKYGIPHPLEVDKDYALLWYGGHKSGQGPGSVPYVAVFFREFRAGALYGKWIVRWCLATLLGQMRIGSIWRNGFSDRQIVFKQYHYVGAYRLEQWSTTIAAGSAPIAAHGYELPNEKERSRLLQLQSQNGVLYVPCLEFFTRCYARDAEINRVLITYETSEIIERLKLQDDVESVTDAWSVWVPPRVPLADARFLAHLRYDDKAWNKVKGIKAELDQQLRQKKLPHAFVPIGPWHFGPAQLKVEGLPLANGDFLGLRITGQTLPETQIHAQYEIGSPNDGSEMGAYPRPQREIREVPEGSSVTVAEHQAADSDTDIYEVKDPAIEILNVVPQITKKAIQKAPHRPTIRVPSAPSDSATPGELGGSGKGVSSLSVQSDAVLLSDGSVRDLWNGLLAIQKANPAIIKSLCWYHPQHKFNESQVQAYVQLPQPKADASDGSDNAEERMMKTRSWLNKPQLLTSRGVCVIRVVSPFITGYLFEVQRVTKPELDGKQTNGDKTLTELENFCGLAVAPPKGAEFESWMNKVLNAISLETGVMNRVLRSIDFHHGEDYRRSSKRTDLTPGITTAMNALSKLKIQDLIDPSAKNVATTSPRSQ